jgi:hypothetical protein
MTLRYAGFFRELEHGYHVEAHNAMVPPDLVDHMRAEGWVPPELSDERLDEVCEEASRPPPSS